MTDTAGRHPTELMTDPFTGRVVYIDAALAPSIALLWGAGIDTSSCCQGPPVYDAAIICFSEPCHFYESLESASPDFDDVDFDSEGYKAYYAAADAWEASRPNGARMLCDLLDQAVGDGTPWHRRWDWRYEDDGNGGSAVLFPAGHIPMLERLLRGGAVTVCPGRNLAPTPTPADCGAPGQSWPAVSCRTPVVVDWTGP